MYKISGQGHGGECYPIPVSIIFGDEIFSPSLFRLPQIRPCRDPPRWGKLLSLFIITFNLLNFMSKFSKIPLMLLIYASKYEINKTDEQMYFMNFFD